MDLSFLGHFDRVYAYERVSSQTQFDRNTIEMQHNRLLGVYPTPHRIYSDVQGGDDSDRREYLGLIQQVQADVITEGLKVLVVITDQSRLSREGVDKVANLVELFDTLGVVLFALDGGLMTVVDPSQRLLLSSKALFDDYFLRQHRQRLRSANAQRRKEGRPLTPSPPLGYKWSREKYLLSEQADLVRQLVGHYLPPPHGSGWSLQRCADWMATQGVSYSPQGVRMLLLNPILRGHLFQTEGGNSREAQKKRREARKAGLSVPSVPPRPVRFFNVHEAILTEAAYKQICWRLSDNKANARNGTNKARYPLSGLVCCGYCNGKMTLHTTIDNRYQRRYPNYVCRNRKCQRQSISIRILEQRLLESLTAKAHEIAALVAQPIEVSVNPEAIQLEQQIQELERMYNQTPLAGLRDAIAEQSRRLEALQNTSPTNKPADLLALVQIFADPLAWALISQAEKRQVYHELVERVNVRSAKDVTVQLWV